MPGEHHQGFTGDLGQKLGMRVLRDLPAVVGHRAAERFGASGALVAYELPFAVPSWTVSM
jgi:hypothetical protein